MPLVRDEQKGTDRSETPSAWPWVLAILGFLVLLGVAFLLIGLVTVDSRRETAASAPPGVQLNTNWVRQAQMSFGYGDYANAAAALTNVDEQQPMELMDKHSYWGLAAESNTKAGKPTIGVKYYERYLSLGASIHQKACADCHRPPASMPPTDLAAMTQSRRGIAYAAAHTAAGTLKSRRDALVRESKSRPNDPRLHILLYHLETALENKAAAKSHANALSALDVKARTSAATSGN